MIISESRDTMPAVPMDHEILKARRAKLGLTQQQVADAAGITQQAYARIETGARTDPAFSTAERVADALRISLDKLRLRTKHTRPRPRP